MDSSLDTRSHELVDKLPKSYRKELREREHVLGVGIGPRRTGGTYNPDCAIIVYVDEKVDEQFLSLSDQVPEWIECDGEPVRTDVQPVVEFSAHGGSPLRNEEIRPVVGGASVGTEINGQLNEFSTTITGLFRRDGDPYYLTARHATGAYANPLGTEVQQPRGGESIGEIINTHGLISGGTRSNKTDTVLIEPDDVSDGSGLYLGWAEATDTGRAAIGDRVIRFSASSGITAGDVSARGVSAAIELPWGDTLDYAGLIEYDTSSSEGDSGAAVGTIDPVTRELTIVGQHVGGSAGSSLMIPWVTIERKFGELVPVTDSAGLWT